MTRSFEPADERPDDSSAGEAAALASSCPRCRAMEDRIAALESEIAALRAAAGGPAPAGERSEAPPTAMQLPRLNFQALRLSPQAWGAGWGLRPSPSRRAWMDEQEHAYHCLPLVIANQWGWQVLCPTDVRVSWNGSQDLAGLHVDVDPQYARVIKSQFGSGIVTFSPPWLFRTPPGWDLYLKGPSNRWKRNCHPLDGVIETWWLNYTFTINWKLAEPGTVFFSRGESIGQLVPVPHATFQEATAQEDPIGLAEPEAARDLAEWMVRRQKLTGEKVNVHHLYRRAEGVEDHLRTVGVPAIESHLP